MDKERRDNILHSVQDKNGGLSREKTNQCWDTSEGEYAEILIQLLSLWTSCSESANSQLDCTLLTS